MVGLGIFFPQLEGSGGEIHVDDPARPSRFGRHSHPTTVTEEIQQAASLTMSTEPAAGHSEVEEKVRILAGMVRFDPKALSLFPGPDLWGWVSLPTGIEQVRGSASAPLPDGQKRTLQTLATPLGQVIPGHSGEGLRPQDLEQGQRSKAVQHHSRATFTGPVETTPGIRLFGFPKGIKRLASLPGLL